MYQKKKLIFIFIGLLIFYYLYNYYSLRYRYTKYVKNSVATLSQDHNFIEIVQGSQNVESESTIVSIFYYLSKSKHSNNDYEIWIMNFLKSVTSPLVLYTDDNFYKKFSPIMKELNINVTFYVSKNEWDCLKLIEKKRNKKYIENYMTHQFLLDPEKSIHSPSLYALWNSKIFLTNSVAELNPYKSKLFIYSDIGAWRDGVHNDWPHKSFVEILIKKIGNNILFGQINDEKGLYHDLIEGGFFAGTSEALKILTESFYNLHDLMIEKGEFIGKDQTMMNKLAFSLIKDKVIRLRTWDLECDSHYDKWFFYQIYLSKIYSCKNDRLSILM
ncbi:unnamed protein product [Brachionus calyciflorus]|uniref:Uncharacterized protein n=1 Tax=Brachionus calyciflorus TaxID=104777 RepID=A0A814C586_9BILA|nr:unnamed protein product [Brachionus calyciflorus]